MANGFFKALVVLGVFLTALAAQGRGDDSGSEDSRLARISSETSQPDRAVDSVDEPGLPPWLDELLTRLPTSDDTSELEEELTEELYSKDTEGPKNAQESREAQPTADSDSFPLPPAIAPLYNSPAMEGEGVWTGEGMPADSQGRPLVYRTFYRPSDEYPNSIAYMALFDIRRVRLRFFIGYTEPGVYSVSYNRDREELSRIVAITNAMWMQQHARGAGAIFRGQVVYPMVTGMATLVVYQDDSVDVLEWSNDIPQNLVKDARQLRHLIVKNGLVVDKVFKSGKLQDAEIGLGGYLIDNNGASTMRNRFWFLANRTAFGVRDDGNLVFVMGHHISTRDLAKALVLAGCKRAIHGDANIHNLACNFYFRDERNKVVRRDRLSPEQLKYTMSRYDQGYAKDFFAFYEK
jgi:hypothetical protein